ncbi:hypothetical protein [Floridanema aerugineum]|uniref:Transcriptional repressor NrdR-like N-terminal domain-containing protein n=1 Tax=Floridaenema aerugineum BLCC-F46 TaxID=3153654 RepID=A0ABV4X7D5_9CYAN
MFTCPKCNSKTIVLDSQKILEHIRRRRECQNCKHRFTTREVIVFGKNTKKFTNILETAKELIYENRQDSLPA